MKKKDDAAEKIRKYFSSGEWEKNRKKLEG